MTESGPARGSKLRSFARLSWTERRWFLEALVIVAILPAALRWVSIRRVRRSLARLSPRPLRDVTDPRVVARAEALTRTVEAAARHAWGNVTCLHRSLALWWLLRWERIESRVILGARRRDGSFEGHAWVELGARVLNDAPEVGSRYDPFPESGSLLFDR